MKKKKNIVVFLTAAIAAITLLACEKEEPIGNKTMVFTYRQTQCADPWPSGSTDAQTIQNLKDYLVAQELGLPFLDIMLTDAPDGSPVNCAACTCKTGKQFIISVLESDSLKQKYIAKGFELKP